MKNNLPNIKHEDLHFACLCAGLRRRNAGLCLKCEVKQLAFKMNVGDYLPKVKAWHGGYDRPFDDGYTQAKNDILRLLEQ